MFCTGKEGLAFFHAWGNWEESKHTISVPDAREKNGWRQIGFLFLMKRVCTRCGKLERMEKKITV